MAFENPTVHWVKCVGAEQCGPTCVELNFEQSRHRRGISNEGSTGTIDIYFDDPELARRFAEAVNSVNATVGEEA